MLGLLCMRAVLLASWPLSSLSTHSSPVTRGAVSFSRTELEGARCRGALRDSCGLPAVWRDLRECNRCVALHAQELTAARCTAANVSEFCQHGACKVSLQQTADPMQGTINTTTKDCLGAIAAYGNQVEADGCNQTADPDDPLTDPKTGQPGHVLAAHCYGWPLPCLKAAVNASCVPPDIRYDGALGRNTVNGTQRQLCEACAVAAAVALEAAGCGVVDIASFCLSSFVVLPGTEAPPSGVPAAADPPPPPARPMSVHCPAALMDACGNRSTQADLGRCTNCIRNAAGNLTLAGCTTSDMLGFCNHGACKAAVASTCGGTRVNVTTKACLGCVGAYADQIQAAGCNGSSPVSDSKGHPSPWVRSTCTQRPCDVLLSQTCLPPSCQNAPQPWGQWCDRSEQASCVSCTARRSTELQQVGCGLSDFEEFCETNLPKAPSYLCPHSYTPRPLPPTASRTKQIRWFSNGALNDGCLLGGWNDIVDGIIECCNGFGLNSSGMFQPFDSPPFPQYLAKDKSVHVTISANVDVATGAGICNTVWANRDQIADAMLSSALKTNITGFNLDWETATPNNVACFVKIWGYVAAKLRPHGVKLQTDIDNHAGGSGDPAPWGYLWNYKPMIGTFDMCVFSRVLGWQAKH